MKKDWLVLKVDEETPKIVKRYRRKNKIKTGEAVDELIRKGEKYERQTNN